MCPLVRRIAIGAVRRTTVRLADTDTIVNVRVAMANAYRVTPYDAQD
jgi:hypothetical protein